MDIEKEREAFNKEFGVDDADTFPAFIGGIEASAALKCNWLGWQKRAEHECRGNPETIEIDGLKIIHKLCRFGADHKMEGCSFTEIVERMFKELEKAQAVPEGFVLVPEEPYAYLIKHKLWNKNSQPEIYLADDFVGNDGVEKEKLIVCIPLYKGEDEAQEQSHD